MGLFGNNTTKSDHNPDLDLKNKPNTTPTPQAPVSNFDLDFNHQNDNSSATFNPAPNLPDSNENGFDNGSYNPGPLNNDTYRDNSNFNNATADAANRLNPSETSRFPEPAPMAPTQPAPTAPAASYHPEPAAPAYDAGSYQEPQRDSGLNHVAWKQTQHNLLDLQQQESQVKEQLKQELLDQRSLLKHDLRQQETVLLNSSAKTGDPAQKIQSQIEEINAGLVQWFGTQKIANHVFFNKKRNYYYLSDSLNLDGENGQPQMLGQLKALFDNMQIPLGYISTDYNGQLTKVIKTLRDKALLTRQSRMINKYQDLQNYSQTVERRDVDIPMTSAMSTVHDAEHNTDKVYSPNQQLVMVIYYQDDNQVHVIEHYRDNNMISRDIFDHNGAISATQYFDQVNSKRVIRENFYRTDGSLVLIKSYQDNEPYIQLLSRSNVLESIFNSELELTLWWLQNHVFDQNTTILVSVDSPLYQPLLALTNSSIELMPILTSYEEHTEIMEQLLNTKTSIDSILVTQEAAKTYIQSNTAHDMDISVLPPAEQPEPSAETASENGGNFSSIPKF